MTFTIPIEQIQQFFGLASQTTSPMTVFDFKTMVGLSGVPMVESTIQYLRDQWNLPAKMSPIAAVVFAILLNVLLALALKNDALSAIYIGFFTGLFSSIWHEKTKTTSQ